MLNVNNYGFIILRQLSRYFYRKLQFSPQLSYTSEINVQVAISWMFIRYFVTKFTYNLNKLAILETHSIKCTVTKFWVSRQHSFYAVFESTNRRFIIHSTCLLKTDIKEKKTRNTSLPSQNGIYKVALESLNITLFMLTLK